MSDEQWGPWIESGLDPCPIMVGEYCQVFIFVDDEEFAGELIANDLFIETWNRFVVHMKVIIDLAIEGDFIIKYRIRKPKGLSILKDILRKVEDSCGIGYNDRREMEEVK